MSGNSKLVGAIVFVGAASLIGCRGVVKDTAAPQGETSAADAGITDSGSTPSVTMDAGLPASSQDAGAGDGGMDAASADAGNLDSGTVAVGSARMKKDAGTASRRIVRKSEAGIALRKDAGVISRPDGGTK